VSNNGSQAATIPLTIRRHTKILNIPYEFFLAIFVVLKENHYTELYGHYG
jgi:hypothetical protein